MGNPAWDPVAFEPTIAATLEGAEAAWLAYVKGVVARADWMPEDLKREAPGDAKFSEAGKSITVKNGSLVAAKYAERFGISSEYAPELGLVTGLGLLGLSMRSWVKKMEAMEEKWGAKPEPPKATAQPPQPEAPAPAL